MLESGNRPAKVITIGRHNTIKEAAARMLSHNVGCLIVNDDNHKFVGLITDRDIAHHIANSPENLGDVNVTQIMTDRIVSCAAGTPTSEARRIMTTNRIRHLPIVEDGVVIGILSARDVMGRQIQEDRAAAEEVAMLSSCLKSIDLNEAAEIVVAQAPRLFKAKYCVLALYTDGDTSKAPELLSSSRCPCLKNHSDAAQDTGQAAGEGSYYSDQIPRGCLDCGGQSPRLVIPLDIIGLTETATGKDKTLSGHLCMCGLDAANAPSQELLSYKARLTREIVTAHLTNAIRYQQARLTSLTDTLTGVGSRKLLEDKLQAECDRAKRYDRPFSVAIIDLDHFKTINDVLGHAAGDEAIRKLAACIDRERRAPDVLARYGGDEFVILMPETGAEDARVLLERIRIEVQRIDAGQDMFLSMSSGIAGRLVGRDDAREIMRRADLALYEAKNDGRNCVRLWNEAMAHPLNANDLDIEKIKKLQRRIAGLSEKAEKMFMESIWGLVQALEAKDPYAKRHTENVMHYAVGIARTMELGPKHVDLIQRAAMIHDIGKIGIPDAVLSKPDDLTPHERTVIEQHPLIAVRILEKMSFLEREVAIVRHHHEKWNGQGYPDGIARTAIPLGARVIAVADTFDALTSPRAYHACRSILEARHILADSAGYELDGEAVAAMMTWFERIAGEAGRSADQLTLADLLGGPRPDLAVMAPVGIGIEP